MLSQARLYTRQGPFLAEEHDEPGDQPAQDAPDGQQPQEHETRSRQFLHRPVVRIALALGIAVLVVAGILFWLHERQYESTDDAFIDARIVRLAPQIAGRVMRVYVNDNDLVRAGQTIVEIDPGDVGARLQQAIAQQATAQTDYQQAQTQIRTAEATYARALSEAAAQRAQAHNAERDFQRYLSLQASNPLAVSQEQIDRASTAARSMAAQERAATQQALAARAAIAAARAQTAGASARIRTLQAQVSEARLNFGYARIVAPVDGHISQRKVAVGSYVDPGQQMLAIVPLQMWVTANFKETQLARMRPGQHVDISIDACPDADAEGHVDSIQRGAGQAFALLPPENATGNYVKVVQRVPVKIVFERVPRNCPLGPGLSVTPRVKVR